MSVRVVGRLAPIGGYLSTTARGWAVQAGSCDGSLEGRASCGDGEHGTPNVIRETRGCVASEDVQRDSRRP